MPNPALRRWRSALPIRWQALPVLLALLFLLTVAFYAWTVNLRVNPVIARLPPSYFSMQAESFLHGQASLLKKPTPDLLASSNPYDPNVRPRHLVHDALLYHGKYYFYWGIAPVLILFLPFRVLTGQYLADAPACLAFAAGGLLFYLLLLRRMRADYFPAARIWVTMSVACLMAFGNLAPYVLRRPLTYESAITFGYLVVAAYCYFVCMGACRGAWRPGYLLAAGLALGLAFLCRPHLTACGLALAGLLVVPVSPQAGFSAWDRRKLLGAALCPAALAVVVQAVYNYSRFGSVAEYGLKYQLAGTDLRNYQIFSSGRGVLNSLYYLFNLPAFIPLFPFVKPYAGGGGLGGPLRIASNLLQLHYRHYGIEPVTGILILIPLLPAALSIGRFLRAADIRAEFRWLAFTILPAALVIFAVDCSAYVPTMRYEMDSAPLFILLIGILVLWIDHQRKRGWLQYLLQAVLPVCVLWSVFLSAALSVTGCCDGLKRDDPAQFNQAASLFAPVERWLIGSHAAYGPVRAELTPPPCVASLVQPILVTGMEEAADFFGLRCDPGTGAFVVTWDHWGRPLQLGGPFSLPPRQPFTLEIQTPALFPLPYQTSGPPRSYPRSCVVTVAGREVFRVENCDVFPAAPSQVYTFHNPVGDSIVMKNYAGTVLRLERIAP